MHPKARQSSHHSFQALICMGNTIPLYAQTREHGQASMCAPVCFHLAPHKGGEGAGGRADPAVQHVCGGRCVHTERLEAAPRLCLPAQRVLHQEPAEGPAWVEMCIWKLSIDSCSIEAGVGAGHRRCTCTAVGAEGEPQKAASTAHRGCVTSALSSCFKPSPVRVVPRQEDILDYAEHPLLLELQGLSSHLQAEGVLKTSLARNDPKLAARRPRARTCRCACGSGLNVSCAAAGRSNCTATGLHRASATSTHQALQQSHGRRSRHSVRGRRTTGELMR